MPTMNLWDRDIPGIVHPYGRNHAARRPRSADRMVNRERIRIMKRLFSIREERESRARFLPNCSDIAVRVRSGQTAPRGSPLAPTPRVYPRHRNGREAGG